MKSIFFVLMMLCTLQSYSQEKPKHGSKKKYGVVFILIDRPKLMYDPLAYRDNSAAYKYMSGLETFTSEVITIDNYSEDEKFKIQDKYRYEMERKLEIENLSVREDGRAYIKSVTLLVSNTYKEASIDRNGK